VLEKYVIVERIAVGGMGEVFVAQQHGVGNFRRTVVLKKLLPDAEGSDEAAQRMLDEARINGALSHENVVTIIEVGTDGGLPWIALEYVHGENAGTLRTRAGKREIPIPIVVCARIVTDSARGLQHAHNAHDVNGRPLNIIHRDIAPKNLFVRHDGVSKVGDFGIARADEKLSHTATGAVAGTLSYMSPEQLTSKPLTPASDQFSLGIVLWELLTGRRLFKGDGPVDTAERILSGKIRAPSRYRPEVSPALDAIALRMLDRDPAKRYPDLGEVADAIDDAVKDAAAAVGRAAVASFVEEMVGHDLRERMRRIEEGAEQAVRADRPRAWEDPSSSRKNADAASALASQASQASTEPTLREGPALPASTSPTQAPLSSTSTPPPPPRWRIPLIAAAFAAAGVLGVVVTLQLRGPPPVDADAPTREHLHFAQRIKPRSFREIVIVEATAAGVADADAAVLAEDLTALMRERFALLVPHWDKPAEARQAERVAVRAAERALIDRVHQRLAPLASSELRADLLEMWQYDSAVPIRFLPPLTLLQIQERVYPNGLELMRETRDSRWDQVDLMAKSAGADPAAVRAALGPLVTKREQLLERFGTARPDELAALETQMDAVIADGEVALQRFVKDADAIAAIVHTAFIQLPSSKRGEPDIDEHADANSKEK
jgi:serine/threonine protein kinase